MLASSSWRRLNAARATLRGSSASGSSFFSNPRLASCRAGPLGLGRSSPLRRSFATQPGKTPPNTTPTTPTTPPAPRSLGLGRALLVAALGSAVYNWYDPTFFDRLRARARSNKASVVEDKETRVEKGVNKVVQKEQVEEVKGRGVVRGTRAQGGETVRLVKKKNTAEVQELLQLQELATRAEYELGGGGGGIAAGGAGAAATAAAGAAAAAAPRDGRKGEFTEQNLRQALELQRGMSNAQLLMEREQWGRQVERLQAQFVVQAAEIEQRGAARAREDALKKALAANPWNRTALSPQTMAAAVEGARRAEEAKWVHQVEELSALSATLGKLEALQDVEAAVHEVTSRLQRKQTAAQQELATRMTRALAEQSQQHAARLRVMENRVRAMRRMLDEQQDFQQFMTFSQELSLAAVELERAVREGGRVDHVWDKLQVLCADHELANQAVSSLSSKQLSGGVDSVRALRSRFRRVRRAATERTLVDENTSFGGHLFARLVSRLMIQRDADTSGSDDHAVLARTGHFLSKQNLVAALAEAEKLSAPARAVARDWMSAVKTRIVVDHVAKLLRAEGQMCLLMFDVDKSAFDVKAHDNDS